MIEFRGEMSEDCRRYILNKERKIGVLVASAISLIFSIPIIILAIVWDWIFSIALIVLIIAVILANLSPNRKSYPLIFPDKIIIFEDRLESISTKFHIFKTIDQVKSVIDMGEWYHIFFFDRPWNSRFVCQKDLINGGTLEEFENLFREKIIRKDI